MIGRAYPDDSDAFDRMDELWRWSPPDDLREDDHADVAREYVILANDRCVTGVMLMARYGDRWVANPWSARPVIAELLRVLKAGGGTNPPPSSQADDQPPRHGDR